LREPDFVSIHRQRRVACLLAIGMLVSGCVLIVPSATLGGAHCGFAGRDTSCGTCVAAKCASAVDACCTDESCGGIIKDLESCSAKGDSTCDRLVNAPEGDGVHRELSACVVKECRDLCASVSPSSLTQCKPAYVSSVDACTCTSSTQPNNVSCTSVAHPNLRCCAPSGWPGPALECSCLTIICIPAIGGCICQLTDKDDQGRDTHCKAGTRCCANPGTGSCICGDRQCAPQEKEVTECNIDALGCTHGEHQVDSCSTPRP
jgi:hypothetical protein